MKSLLVPLAVLVLPGCFLLPDIDFGMCGNGYVDPNSNEDCDVAVDPALGDNLECGAPDDPIRKCRYVCGTSAGAPSCPVGWRCGADGICLFASGEYREIPTAALGAPARTLEIGDFDGDGRDDLLALTSVGLSFRFSGDTGLTDASLEIPVDVAPSAQLSVLDLDEDGLTDVAVPLANGVLVLRGSPGRFPDSVPYPQLSGLPPEFEFHAATTQNGERRFAVGTDTQGDRICMMFGVDPFNRSVCTQPDTSFAFPAHLDGTRRSVVTSTQSEVFVTVHGDRAVHAYDIGCNATCTDLWIRPARTIALPGASEGGLRLADFDGDGDLDLLINGAPQPMVAVRGPTGFADAVRPPALANVPWPLDARDFDGDGRADYLAPSGLYVRGQAGLTPLYRASPPWREARFGDFNGDGRLDIAATSSVARIRVLLNAGDGIFNQGDLVTTARVRALTVGDFDGDLVDDITFAQDEYLNDANAGTTLATAFGTGLGAPTNPISMGRADYVRSLETINLPTNHEPERIDDILLNASEHPDGGRRSVTFLAGTRARRLTSLLTPPDAAGESLAVIALASTPAHASGTTEPIHLINLRRSNGMLSAWLMRGSGSARFAQENMQPLALGTLCGGAPLEPACLVGQSVRFIDEVRDAALLVDACGGRVMVLLETGGEYQCRSGTPLPPGIRVQQGLGAALSLVDLNRDTRPEVLLVTDGSVGPPSAVVAWDAEPSGFAAVTEVSLADQRRVSDLVAIDVDADRDLELMILTDRDLRVGDISLQDGFQQRSIVLTRDFSPRARLAVADVNGDGLQDVIISDDAKLYTLLGRAGQPQ